MQITNKFNLPESIVNAIRNDPYQSTGDISVTRLISPARKVALERAHYKDLEEDASEKIWSLFGQAMHVVLERAEHVADTEARFSIERQGWVLSGQFDHFDPIFGVLTDYKVTSTYAVKNGYRAEWVMQMNILAAILREHGYKVNKLQVIVILRDWSKSMTQRSADYPDQPVITFDVPVWNEEKCEEFIDERIRIHQAARDKLPECTAEERWQTDDVFALMKEGRRTAVKLYSDKDEADEALKVAGEKHYLDLRPGKSIRCESFCPAAPWCAQYQSKKDK
ncbi:MAG: hypothetical protein CVV41_18105 [Candidatus Riflebacteria bacterium HGW-Riflebacteria-1]|jgi:hypothetical protein|nr:MAG: hypothetical protein CVV41_18105 [Candidatus Riflebacteria bacterium HGW-Riflebacteria-1]